MNLQQKNKGFTIIEVVLVLAIAGLIFLIVFLALPALQRQQRDTQRRSDAGRVLTAVQNFQSNNNGKVPVIAADVTQLLGTYVKANGTDTFKDPSGTDYALTLTAVATGGSTAVADNTINYYTAAKCSGENAVAGATNNAAIRVKLENGGSYCVSNTN
jgi:prepilin-type N-terminal cleavage/methylation domain-containing protein